MKHLATDYSCVFDGEGLRQYFKMYVYILTKLGGDGKARSKTQERRALS
jgi:hypothetical protein